MTTGTHTWIIIVDQERLSATPTTTRPIIGLWTWADTRSSMMWSRSRCDDPDFGDTKLDVGDLVLVVVGARPPGV